MKQKAFTLIEMMIAVSVMAVLVMGGTLVFFRTLGSSGINQAQLNINSSSNQLMQAIENNIRYQKIRSISSGSVMDRADCVAAGATGGHLSGDTLVVYDQFDSTTYNLLVDGENSMIASNSAAISTPNLLVKSVNFDWYCIPGSNDKLRITIVVNDTGLSASVPDRTQIRDINMYNSY